MGVSVYQVPDSELTSTPLLTTTDDQLVYADHKTWGLLRQEVAEQLGKRVALLEGELRAAKRRETKLAATHFRLRQDIASADGDLKCAACSRIVPKHACEAEAPDAPGTLASHVLLLHEGLAVG